MTLIIIGSMMFGAGLKGLIDRPRRTRMLIEHTPFIR